MRHVHLKAMARRHWTRHLPKKVAELRAEGMLEVALQMAANQAGDRITELMDQGYRLHEAEEVARIEFLLLAPEPVDEDDWEAEELAQLEREYQEMMREPPEPLEPSPIP